MKGDSRVPILKASGLRVNRGGIDILDLASFELLEGEVLSLIGPNGAGKTTLLQAVALLTKPTAGDISFRGSKVEFAGSVLDYRRRIAMVFQEPLLFNTTVFENVAAGLKFRRMGKKEIRDAVGRQLERFGISSLRDRSGRTLSGGEAQRTSLARAFAIAPEILFLDEPFASLDPPTREALLDDLETALKNTGTTAVMATHDRNEALRLSDRIGVMMNGRIVQSGPPDEVMNRPADESVASFIGTESILSGRIEKRNEGTIAVSVAGREIQAVGDGEAGEQVLLFIRPENITLSDHPDRSSARNNFRGRVLRAVPTGFFYRVYLDCGFPLTCFVTRSSLDELSIREGGELYASFKATAIHVIRKGRHS